VTEFNYRISDERHAHVFVGLTISRRDEAERIERSLVELATRYLDAAVIENDDLDDEALERALERALCRAAPPVPREAS
jgi:hypothetical protein